VAKSENEATATDRGQWKQYIDNFVKYLTHRRLSRHRLRFL